MKFVSKVSLLLPALLSPVITSCGDELRDGDWDSFSWHIGTSTEYVMSPTVNVPATGGEYTLHCTNYTSYWPLYVTVNSNIVWNEDVSSQLTASLPMTINSEYIEATISNADLYAKLPANTSASPRTIIISLEAGDAFDDVTFVQAAAAQE